MDELIVTFQECVKEGLRTLVHDHGAVCQSGFSTFDGKPARLVDRDSGAGFFWFVCRYTFPGAVLDVGYGDKERIVEPMIFYPRAAKEFPPWLLLEASAVQKPKGIGGQQWVLDREFMVTSVELLTTGLANSWSVLQAPADAVFDRAQSLLGRRLLFAQAEQKKKDIERACVHASEAFHRKDYQRAIHLLAPFRRDPELPASALRMLELAEKR